MKRAKDQDSYFFVDESGDPVFYNAKGRLIVGTDGCSPLLILGFIETQNPSSVRQSVVDLQTRLIADPYLAKIPSISKTALYLHAKDDAPEVRYEFYKLIRELDFKAQFVVCRKQEDVFRSRHKGKTNKFYDDLVTSLFDNVLHRYLRNNICVATRGSSEREKPIKRALWRAKYRFEKRHAIGLSESQFQLALQNAKGEPCLSVIDYMNWALYRAYTRNEMRYLDYVSSKVSFVKDISVPGQSALCFFKKRPFKIENAALLGLGSSSERTAWSRLSPPEEQQ